MLPEMDNQNWQLISPLVYESAAAGKTVTVPAGFITDFVSFAPLKNIGQRAAVVHDFLYSLPEFDRGIADEVLKEALESVGVSAILAIDMFVAVRAFGGSHKAK